MSNDDRRTQRVEQVTVAVVAALSRMRASLSTIDGGHKYVDRLMGREGERRIIKITLDLLNELGIHHKTDRTARRAIAYKLRGPGIGFSHVDFDAE